MGADEFQALGAHSYRIEDDVFFMRVKGEVNLADMVEILRVIAQIKRERGSVFALYDSRENTGLEPAARKYAADNGSEATQTVAAASFGAPFAMRIVVNMINRAHGLLRIKSTPTVLFDTEAQARTYLQVARERAKSSKKGWPFQGGVDPAWRTRFRKTYWSCAPNCRNVRANVLPKANPRGASFSFNP